MWPQVKPKRAPASPLAASRRHSDFFPRQNSLKSCRWRRWKTSECNVQKKRYQSRNMLSPVSPGPTNIHMWSAETTRPFCPSWIRRAYFPKWEWLFKWVCIKEDRQGPGDRCFREISILLRERGTSKLEKECCSWHLTHSFSLMRIFLKVFN